LSCAARKTIRQNGLILVRGRPTEDNRLDTTKKGTQWKPKNGNWKNHAGGARLDNVKNTTKTQLSSDATGSRHRRHERGNHHHHQRAEASSIGHAGNGVGNDAAASLRVPSD
jgi:hypothetical protein